MRRLPRTARSWLLVLAVTLAVSALLAAWGLPSPVLFGSLVGGMVQALTGRPASSGWPGSSEPTTGW